MMDKIYKYPEEFRKPILKSLEFLRKFSYISFESDASFWSKYWRLVYMIPLYILHYVSSTLGIVRIFTEGMDPFEKADIIPLWIVATQEIIKISIIVHNRTKVEALIERLGSIWKTTDLTEEQIKKKNSALKILHYGQNILYKVGLSVSWQFLLVPLVEMLVRMVFWAQEPAFALPLAAVYPFAVDNWTTYIGAYVFQIYNAFQMVYKFLGINTLVIVLSTHLGIQFMLLQEDVSRIKPTNTTKIKQLDAGEINNEECAYSIICFIRRHQYVLMLTEQLNAIFNKIVFINMLFSTVIICFFAMAAKASTRAADKLNNTIAFMIVMFNVFIMCACGELLNESSTGIALSALKNNWYIGDIQYQSMIWFIIMRSQRPCVLKSLHSSINIKTFNKVLKTTYSYFSLASQLYDANNEG